MTRARTLVLLALCVLAALLALVMALNVRGEAPLRPDAQSRQSVPITAELLQRGALLSLAGNCAGCHTAPGGAAMAGGLALQTPFGAVYPGNLTPHPQQGLGRWSPDHFWRAMHHGRSRDGRLLTPAFPYPSFTRITRADSDALWAHLQSLPAVDQATPPHALRFPFNTQAALAVWRALYFRPLTFTPEPTRSAEWNRGAYLVRGLGHCAACHAPRNALGATPADDLDLSGGLMPAHHWHAPSLLDPSEAGVSDWSVEQTVALLQTGRSGPHTVLGPMADVVFRSTQHLPRADLQAMAVFLKSLPVSPRAGPGDALGSAARFEPAAAPVLALGARLYERHCAGCHGDQGQGSADGVHAALAGHRSVTMGPATNLVRVVLQGGFAPTTAGHPQPHGMPPFAQTLTDDELAALATHVRQSWGNRASSVTALEVLRLR